MEERTMDVIEKFGNRVSSQALKDPEKARRLLLAGYRLQEKKLQFLPDRGLPSSGQYVARVVMKNIIQSLSEPENAAMVSIFVPGELVMAAGLTPYSVEAMSCFMAGTKCEQTFLRKTEEEGFPETMCSYHRVFLGAALTGILPKPNCMIYTIVPCSEMNAAKLAEFDAVAFGCLARCVNKVAVAELVDFLMQIAQSL